ncbi:MAG: bifunctional glutamate N-acetyltransferase/amino-acid acetyltransferase ArgJ [Phycisphaeraceae bacterium]|nr:bifunctional glutamate N-acetyltransferase/amino-acid acetyltransferase ArgJ [Phycisphaeraceae bacterium]
MNDNASDISITDPAGFKAAGVTCGIKPSGKPDLALIVADRAATAAGVFTRNRFVGAPVTVSREHVADGRARAIVCNSGISNVATGEQGIANAREMCRRVGARLDIDADHVLVCSTGIIGPHLPMEKIRGGIDKAAGALAADPQGGHDAAGAILTTDKVTKTAGTTVDIDGTKVTVAGMAKGSGMIAPNMATMLAFLTTDAAIEARPLRRLLIGAVATTFNRISVDADTSTSDTALLLASGMADHTPITDHDSDAWQALSAAVTDVCRDLAEQIVRDGEGVTRPFTVEVIGAVDAADADRVGRTVVNSPLVKTAVHGGDPNWGRLVMAVGRSGAELKPERLSITIDGIPVLTAGEPDDLDADTQKRLEDAMTQAQVTFEIDLGLGDATARWLGADLSYEYVRINAEYTT